MCRYLIQVLQPDHLWLSFPCTAFCAWMKLAMVRDYDILPRLKEGRFHLGYAFVSWRLPNALRDGTSTQRIR